MSNLTYTTGRPAGNISPSAQRLSMQTNNDSNSTIWDIDHFGFNNNNGGYHKKVTLVAGSAMASVAGTAVQYSKTSSGSSEIFLRRDGVATEIQLTRGGVSASANGYTFLPGGLLLQWGSVVATTGGTSFTFPTPFTSSVYSVTIGMRASGAQASAIGVPTTTAVTVYSASGSQTVYVMAIGI